MANEKMTMKDRVLQYMKDFGSITSFQAFTDLGNTRLSASIFQIREEYNVEDEWVHTTNRYGVKVKYKKYTLGEKYDNYKQI